MKNSVVPGKYLTTALALAAFAIVSAAPALAKQRTNPRHLNVYAYAPEDSGFQPGRGPVDAARTAALRACNDAADKWAYTT